MLCYAVTLSTYSFGQGDKSPAKKDATTVSKDDNSSDNSGNSGGNKLTKIIGYYSDSVYTIDFNNGGLSPKRLPFDVPFVLKSKNLSPEITRVELKIRNKKYAPCNGGDCADECISCKEQKLLAEINAIQHDIGSLLSALKANSVEENLSRETKNKLDEIAKKQQGQEKIVDIARQKLGSIEKEREKLKGDPVKLDSIIQKQKDQQKRLNDELEKQKNEEEAKARGGKKLDSLATVNKERRAELNEKITKLLDCEKEYVAYKDADARRQEILKKQKQRNALVNYARDIIKNKGDTSSLKKTNPVEYFKLKATIDSVNSVRAIIDKEITLFENDSEGTQCNCKIKCADLNKICITVCPWRRNSFTNDSPVMRLDVPPLKANQEYSFYFKFYRKPTPDESKKLREAISGTLKNIADSLIQTDLQMTDLRSKPEIYQEKIQEQIRAFYLQKYNEDVSSSSTLLDETNKEVFLTLLLNMHQTSGPDLLETLVIKVQSAIEDYNANTPVAGRTWRGLPLQDTKEKTGLLTLTRISANTPDYATIAPMITECKKLFVFDNLEISQLVRGNTNINRTGNTGADLENNTRLADIEPYNTNITQTIASIKTVADGLYNNFILQPGIRTALHIDSTKVANLLWDIKSLHSQLTSIQTSIVKLKNARVGLDSLANKFADHFINQISFNSRQSLNSNASYQTRAEWYISGDVGLAYVAYNPSGVNQFIPYYGVNFNLFPINRQRKYHVFQKQYGCKGYWLSNIVRNVGRNLSVVVGITVGSASAPGISDTFSNKSLLTGLSVRISDPVRLTAGAIWNNVQKNYPLSTDKTLTPYFYTSLSFDLDLKTYLGKLASLWP